MGDYYKNSAYHTDIFIMKNENFPSLFSALVQTLEKSKKKYQSRLKKLEQQMLGMVERHAAQV